MVPTTIEEAAALQHSIAVECRCRRRTTFNSMGLWWQFQQKCWDQRFGPARSHFFYWLCWTRISKKVRPIELEPVRGTAKTDVMLPFPPEHEWKRAMGRVR